MNYKVDFVLPWVDSSDREWQKEKEQYNLIEDNDINSNSRYRDMGTLKYVLRGIEKNCPWYNKIYIITTGHYPKWLDIDHKKIVLVKHEDIYFDKSHLPTFNSNSIEMNILNIQELSDKFIYLNDDMIILREVTKDRFFKNSKPIDFFSHSWIKRGKLFEKIRGRDSWIHSLNNNIEHINKSYYPYKVDREKLFHKSYPTRVIIANFLLKYIYKKIFWLEHWHHPQPYLKNTLKEAYKNFHNDMLQCSKNRFRSNSDLTPYLYRYIHLVKGDFEPYYNNDSIVSNLNSIDILYSLIEKIDSNIDIKFACFNDSTNLIDDEYDIITEKLNHFLDKYLPEKASFEL